MDEGPLTDPVAEYWRRRAILAEQLGEHDHSFAQQYEEQLRRKEAALFEREAELAVAAELKYRAKLAKKVSLHLWAAEFGYGPVL